MNHSLSLFVPPAFRLPAAPTAQVVTTLLDTAPAKPEADSTTAPATTITHDRRRVTPSRAMLKFEVKQT